LSADRFGESHYAKPCGIHTIVNFTKGEIDETATNIGFPYWQSGYYSIRAVRSIK
jgi:hypothetical protein